MAAKRYLDVRYDVTDLSDEEVDQLALEAGAQAERSDGHPTVEVEIKTNDDDDDEAGGGASLTPEAREAVERLLDIPADDEQTPPFGRVPLRNFVANVLGEDLIDHDMPVESKPDPVRPSDEGLLILYGDKRDGVTVVVAATDEDDAERRILATFSDEVFIDCIEESTDQRPLSIRLVAGLVSDEETARRLLEIDAENAR